MVRKIKPEMLLQLDSVERVVADRFILEGRWILEKTPDVCRNCTNEDACPHDYVGASSDSSICGDINLNSGSDGKNE